MPLTVRTGENVLVHCNATGDEPIDVNWHSEDHRPIPPYVSKCSKTKFKRPMVKINIFISRNVRISGRYLEFFTITQSNAGRYYCEARNRYGNVTKTADVIVSHNEVSDRTTQGRVQEVVEGETVALDCIEPESREARVRIALGKINTLFEIIF